MQRTRLGSSDLEISRIVFGSMWRTDTGRSETERLLDTAIDLGVTSIDTAPLYGFGEVEERLGAALGGRRDRIELLSKVGLRWDDDHGDVLFGAILQQGHGRFQVVGNGDDRRRLADNIDRP